MNTPYEKVCPRCLQPFSAKYSSCPHCDGINQPQVPMSWEISIHTLPPEKETIAVQIISEVLGIGIEKAHWRMQQPSRLLGVALEQGVVWKLKTELRKIGVIALERFASVRIDAFLGEPSDPIPTPPPISATRRMSLKHQVIIPYAPIVETRTVVGLSLGQANTYMAFVRAQGDHLLALPSIVSIDGQPSVPTVVTRPKTSSPVRTGKSAIRNYILNPDEVLMGFVNQVGLKENLEAVSAFLSFLHGRLIEVTGLESQQVIHVSLGGSLSFRDGTIPLLIEVINKSGLQVDQVVPEPLATIATFQQLGNIPLLAAGQTQHIIVIDAGNTGFRISCVERKDNGEMIVIDNQNVLVGHDIDTILLNWIISHFPLHPDEQILREIEVFVQDFKVQMSRSFSNGKPDHNQFCVVGGLSSPLLLVINRDEFEQMVSQSIQQLSDAIRESPARVGLGCENISYVLVAGGSANWFFLSKLIQENLKQTPFKESRPEETIVKGLTLYGLTR